MADPKPQQGGAAPRGNSIEELRYMQQIYQNQYALVGQEISARLENLKQYDTAQKTLEEADAVKGKGVLMPMGAEVFANAKLGELKTVLVGVGGGYLLEESVDEAKGYISRVKEKELQGIQRMMKGKGDLEAALIEISYRIEEMSH